LYNHYFSLFYVNNFYVALNVISNNNYLESLIKMRLNFAQSYVKIYLQA
jgi:hypothetical protein